MTDKPVQGETTRRHKMPIPIGAARDIAERYCWDQVIIVARRVGDGEDGGEHVTTYGRDVPNCAVAAKIGDFFKFKLMGWNRAEVTDHD